MRASIGPGTGSQYHSRARVRIRFASNDAAAEEEAAHDVHVEQAAVIVRAQLEDVDGDHEIDQLKVEECYKRPDVLLHLTRWRRLCVGQCTASAGPMDCACALAQSAGSPRRAVGRLGHGAHGDYFPIG